MTADPHKLRFFVDETSLGLGKGLAALRDDVIHTGHPLIPEVPLGSADPDWIPAAGRGLVVLTRDKRIRTKHSKLVLLCEHGLRVFVVGPKRDLSNWEAARLLMRHWDGIESKIKDMRAGPWFMRIHDRGITRMPIR